MSNQMIRIILVAFLAGVCFSAGLIAIASGDARGGMVLGVCSIAGVTLAIFDGVEVWGKKAQEWTEPLGQKARRWVDMGRVANIIRADWGITATVEDDQRNSFNVGVYLDGTSLCACAEGRRHGRSHACVHVIALYQALGRGE